MDKLNYDTLQKLTRAQRDHLELVELDAVRLRDDRSEIRSGDEVAFVATGKLRLTRDGLGHLRAELPECKPLLQELADGDDLLAIGCDAELESALPMDAESVKRWLAEHFAFTFLLDGEDSDHFRAIGRHDGALPWARTLNTGIVRGDHFDVGVRVDHATCAPPQPGTTPRTVLAHANVHVALDHAGLALGLSIEAPYATAHELVGKTFWLPMHPVHDDVRLVVSVREVTAKPPTPPQVTNKSSDKHR